MDTAKGIEKAIDELQKAKHNARKRVDDAVQKVKAVQNSQREQSNRPN